MLHGGRSPRGASALQVTARRGARAGRGRAAWWTLAAGRWAGDRSPRGASALQVTARRGARAVAARRARRPQHYAARRARRVAPARAPPQQHSRHQHSNRDLIHMAILHATTCG